MDFLPTIGWVSVLANLILGGFALFQIFGKGVLAVRKESDEADDRLIALLKDTVDGLERKVASLETKYESTKTELTRMRTENEVMQKLLQGRDATSLEYQKAGMETMKKVDSILDVVQANNKHIANLYELLEEHLEILSIGKSNKK